MPQNHLESYLIWKITSSSMSHSDCVCDHLTIINGQKAQAKIINPSFKLISQFLTVVGCCTYHKFLLPDLMSTNMRNREKGGGAWWGFCIGGGKAVRRMGDAWSRRQHQARRAVERAAAGRRCTVHVLGGLSGLTWFAAGPRRVKENGPRQEIRSKGQIIQT